MIMRRKMLVLSLVVLAIGFFSVSFTDDEPKFKNLKVLSKNTTHDEMQLIMKGFKTALGQKCNFCHAESKTAPGKLDFASDENKHKDIARYMMRMTNKINRKYFKDEKESGITCFTCHHGEKEPPEAPKEVLEDH
jgi:ABC-type uncharacterized transport system substrate-binding protein